MKKYSVEIFLGKPNFFNDKPIFLKNRKTYSVENVQTLSMTSHRAVIGINIRLDNIYSWGKKGLNKTRF